MADHLDEGVGDLLSQSLMTVPHRKLAPHFIRDKFRGSFGDKGIHSVDSNSKDGTLLKKNSYAKWTKKDSTLISLLKKRSLKEEYSTQAYEIRSLNINSKLSCVLKRGSAPSLDCFVLKNRAPSLVEKFRKQSEVEDSVNTSSLMNCINNPSQVTFCEKMPVSHFNKDMQAIVHYADHCHRHIRSVKGSVTFKNRFLAKKNSIGVPPVNSINQGEY